MNQAKRGQVNKATFAICFFPLFTAKLAFDFVMKITGVTKEYNERLEQEEREQRKSLGLFKRAGIHGGIVGKKVLIGALAGMAGISSSILLFLLPKGLIDQATRSPLEKHVKAEEWKNNKNGPSPETILGVYNLDLSARQGDRIAREALNPNTLPYAGFTQEEVDQIKDSISFFSKITNKIQDDGFYFPGVAIKERSMWLHSTADMEYVNKVSANIDGSGLSSSQYKKMIKDAINKSVWALNAASNKLVAMPDAGPYHDVAKQIAYESLAHLVQLSGGKNVAKAVNNLPLTINAEHLSAAAACVYSPHEFSGEKNDLIATGAHSLSRKYNASRGKPVSSFYA